MRGDEQVRQYMGSIVGNERLTQKLCLDILAGRLAHAFIIEGKRGTGKHTLALNTAAALACSAKDATDSDVPCGTCPECKKIFEGKSPDIITVGCEGKTTLGVDAVRFLKDDVHTVPNDLDFKLYIIEDADKMTVQAQNALLLTLEEPPSFVRFILLCENADLLLETIRSRAPVLRTEPISNADVDEYICKNDRRAAQMKLSSTQEYNELLMAAKNGIGTALELLDPKTFAPIREMRRLAEDVVDNATDGSGARRIFPLLSRFSQKRDVLAKQLACLSEAVNDLILIKKSDNAPLCFFADRDRAIELCDRCSMSFLYELGKAVLKAIDNNARNANVRLTLIKLMSDASLI